MSKKIDSVATDLIKNSKLVIKLAKEIKSTGFSFGKLKKVVQQVCIIVETYTNDVGILSSSAKIELAVEIINIIVDIPYIPEWLERKIFKVVVKKVVNYLNKKFGDEWLKKAKEFVD